LDITEILLVAVGLAMDCFSVAITSGLIMKEKKPNFALKVGASFGFFQSIMPVIGWLGGTSLLDLISGVDHWIAFALLSLIGGKMLFEAIKRKSGEEKADPSSGHVLLTLSVATSIDALAVGVGFAFLRVAILFPVVVIGIIAFVMSFFGVYLGDRFGQYFGTKIEIVGGLILIGIGIKILLEHTL
jgi:putative Mn2+ efflux pump MntP